MRSHRLKLRVAGQEERLVVAEQISEQITVEEQEPVLNVDNNVIEEKIEEPPQVIAGANEIKQNALKKPPFKKK